jgi:hypothetical protein
MQTSAVQQAAKAFEGSQSSSQASSNLAISMNQDMSANSATAAAQFSNQTTQASQQVAVQSNQSPQQTVQTTSQTQQANKSGPQVQQQQQDTQQTQTQSTSLVQVQSPQPQDTQQTQTQSTSLVQAQAAQQQDTQQIQTQSTGQMQLQAAQQQDTQQTQTQSTGLMQAQAAQQQDTQPAQVQSSTSFVKLLPPQQQEQQIQSQPTAGSMSMPQPVYTPPVQQQDTQSTQVAILKPPAPMVVETQQQTSSSGTGLIVSRNLFAYNPLMSSNTSNMSLPLPAPQPTYQPKLDTRQTEIETPQFQIASFSGAGRAGNPLSEIMMQQRFEMMQNNITQPLSSVNRNVQPNDLAVGVDLTSMSTVPAGFNAYSIVLKDAAFYEPKEVYKNQKTVDNERVLRGLTRGSDRLHQEMVDQQYKGN